MTTSDPNGGGEGPLKGPLLLRLYIAGSAPNSLRATETLRRLCTENFAGHYTLEIVDVLKEPLRALNDDILVTPTLIKLGPGTKARVIGDLSDVQKVLPALRDGRGP